MIANYHSIETFSSLDGPGIRYVLFLQGCNMRCKFCHNPDMLALNSDKTISVSEIVADYMKYEKFYTNGGITVSGGEPLLQIDFIIALFTELKKYNVHTCIQTQGSLYDESSKYQQLAEITDLFLINLKGVDNEYSQAICKYNIDQTLDLLDFLNANSREFTITYVLLPTINDNQYCVDKLAELLKNYDSNLMSFKILPYHKLGIEKWERLNKRYKLPQINEPSNEDVEMFVEKIKRKLYQ